MERTFTFYLSSVSKPIQRKTCPIRYPCLDYECPCSFSRENLAKMLRLCCLVIPLLLTLATLEGVTAQCDSKSRFQNLDGTCNNLNNPALGSAKTPFMRLPVAGAHYADGISTPRHATDETDLPNARRVSLELFPNKDQPSATMSHMAMSWGEFVCKLFTVSTLHVL